MDFTKIVDKLSLILNLKLDRKGAHNNSLKVKDSNVPIVNQVGNSIEKQIILQHNGISYADAKSLVEDILNQKLPEFTRKAEETFKSRSAQFEGQILKQLSTLDISKLNKLQDPDTQLSVRHAQYIGGRKSSDEFRNILADLVIKRIQNDSVSGSLMDIVYNEAISTIEKLTIDQLKIISFCYLARYTRLLGVNTWEQLDTLIKKNYEYLLDFKNTPTEFRHIEYSGCGAMSNFVSYSLLDTLKRSYSLLFINSDIPKSEIEAIGLSPEVINSFFIETSTDLYRPIHNLEDASKLLEEMNVSKEVVEKFVNLCVSHLDSDTVVKQKMSDNTEIGGKVLKIWEESGLTSLSLTSVGMVVAASYIEQYAGTKLNMSIWIN